MPWAVAEEIVNGERSVTHARGMRVLGKLREMGAPDIVIASVERPLMPPPERPPGVRTHDLRGSEMAEQRKRTSEGLQYGQPKTHEALQRSGFAPKEIRRRTEARRETVSKALYERCGRLAAKSISEILDDALSSRKRLRAFRVGIT